MNRNSKHEPFDLGLCKCVVVEMVTAIWIFLKGHPLCTMSLAQKSVGVQAYKTLLPQDL